MGNYNRVFLIGNLTRDPELRYIPSGQAVCTFTVASNRTYRLQSGERKEEATFVRVVTWARRAETCGEFLTKGSPVFVEGRLQNRSWEGQDGQKRTTTEVVALNVQFLGRVKSGAGAPTAPPLAETGAPEEEINLDEPVNNQTPPDSSGLSEKIPF